MRPPFRVDESELSLLLKRQSDINPSFNTDPIAFLFVFGASVLRFSGFTMGKWATEVWVSQSEERRMMWPEELAQKATWHLSFQNEYITVSGDGCSGKLVPSNTIFWPFSTQKCYSFQFRNKIIQTATLTSIVHIGVYHVHIWWNNPDF